MSWPEPASPHGAPRCDPSPVDSIPPSANSSVIVGLPCLASPKLLNSATVQSAPHAPVDAPAMPIIPGIDVTKAKVPLNPFSPLLSSCLYVLGGLRAPIPNRPHLFSPLHSYSYLPLALFRRWLPTRLVATLPRLLHWIGTPSRPHLPSPIIVWPSGEVQDVPSRKLPCILLTIPPRTIQERVRIYRTTHIPVQSTNMDIVVGRRFLEPWRPPKIRT